MAGNVFGASEKAHVIKADKAIVKIGSQTALALGVTIQYQRPVQQVPVLAEEDVISVGKGSGTFTAETILMKNAFDITGGALITGDGCKPDTISISFQDGNCESKTKPITCKNCIASAVSVTAQGGRGYVAAGVSVTFTAMSFS